MEFKVDTGFNVCENEDDERELVDLNDNANDDAPERTTQRSCHQFPSQPWTYYAAIIMLLTASTLTVIALFSNRLSTVTVTNDIKKTEWESYCSWDRLEHGATVDGKPENNGYSNYCQKFEVFCNEQHNGNVFNSIGIISIILCIFAWIGIVRELCKGTKVMTIIAMILYSSLCILNVIIYVAPIFNDAVNQCADGCCTFLNIHTISENDYKCHATMGRPSIYMLCAGCIGILSAIFTAFIRYDTKKKNDSSLIGDVTNNPKRCWIQFRAQPLMYHAAIIMLFVSFILTVVAISLNRLSTEYHSYIAYCGWNGLKFVDDDTFIGYDTYCNDYDSEYDYSYCVEQHNGTIFISISILSIILNLFAWIGIIRELCKGAKIITIVAMILYSISCGFNVFVYVESSHHTKCDVNDSGWGPSLICMLCAGCSGILSAMCTVAIRYHVKKKVEHQMLLQLK